MSFAARRAHPASSLVSHRVAFQSVHVRSVHGSKKNQKQQRRPTRKQLEWHDEAKVTPTHEGSWKVIDSTPLRRENLGHVDKNQIPHLAHGLERVVKDKSMLHPLRDLDTQEFNFSSDLHKIESVEKLDLSSISEFMPAADDKKLIGLAEEHQCLVLGSTSSVTPILSKLYNFLSDQRHPDFPTMSKGFDKMPQNMVLSMQRPSAMRLMNNNGSFSISQYSVSNPKNGSSGGNGDLLILGHILEKFLTLDAEEFKELTSMPATEAQLALRSEVRNETQVYNFLKVGKCLFRSQLDCYDPDTGQVFDIKTRATAGIRYNMDTYKEHIDDARANISKLRGIWSSYEREYYDLVRSKFLPFSMQLRIGQMDGAFLCYHNTDKVFGFQYVPLEEIDHRVYGSPEQAEWCFDTTCKLLEEVVGAISERCGDEGDLTVVTTLGRDHLDFYVDPMERSNLTDPVKHFRLQLKKGSHSAAQHDPAAAYFKRPEISTLITESLAPYSQFQKFLFASGVVETSVNESV